MKIIPQINGYYDVAKIIWKYATGKDFETQTQSVDVPSDADLQTELEAAGLMLPAGVKLKVVVDDPNTFHIVLRDRATMIASLADMRSNTGVYDFDSELKDEYAEFLADSTPYEGSDPVTKENRVRLVSHRLGDYTFSTCAS